MEEIIALLIPIACGCVLPIMIVWLAIRQKMNETNQRTQIVLAALEKNPDMNMEELIKSMNPKKKLLKEKLLSKLFWGCLTTIIGLGFIGFGTFLYCNNAGGTSDPMASVCIGLLLAGIGIAFLVNYYTGKKLLAEEMVAEEQALKAQSTEVKA